MVGVQAPSWREWLSREHWRNGRFRRTVAEVAPEHSQDGPPPQQAWQLHLKTTEGRTEGGLDCWVAAGASRWKPPGFPLPAPHAQTAESWRETSLFNHRRRLTPAITRYRRCLEVHHRPSVHKGARFPGKPSGRGKETPCESPCARPVSMGNHEWPEGTAKVQVMAGQLGLWRMPEGRAARTTGTCAPQVTCPPPNKPEVGGRGVSTSTRYCPGGHWVPRNGTWAT